jgi:hypothetical protein
VWDKPWVLVPMLGRVAIGPFDFSIGGARPLGAYLVYAGLTLSLAAAAQYTVRARRMYREALAEERTAAASTG